MQRAKDVREIYGRYFEVNVGSEGWFKSVPRDNRGQVLAQAVTMDCDYVLFTESVPGKRLYSALVHITEDQRSVFASSITKWEHLMTWALDSLDRNGPPPQVPNAFTQVSQKVLESHLRLWRAVRKKINRKGRPLTPVKIFKCLIQVYYNKVKGGIDGNTKYIKGITGLAKKEVPMTMEKKIVVRAMKHLFVNAVIAHRILQTNLVDVEDEQDVGKIVKKATSGESMNSMMDDLFLDLARHAADLRSEVCSRTEQMNNEEEDMSGSVIAESELTDFRSTVRDRTWTSLEQSHEYFNNGVSKRIRCSEKVPHRCVKMCKIPYSGGKMRTKQKKCILCTRKTTTKCFICEVALCMEPDEEERESTLTCYERWHRNQTLEMTNKSKRRLREAREKKNDSYKRRKRRLSESSSSITSVSSTSSITEEEGCN